MEIGLLSVIIPTRTEKYLQKTVDDLLVKSEGDVEIIVVFDGYVPLTFNSTDARVKTLGTEAPVGMRACINAGVEHSKGEFIMKTDEHCMFGQGYDVKLKLDCKDDWVVIPRRYRLDADKWEVIDDGRPPVDYMYLSDKGGELHGWKWDDMGKKNQTVLLDETPSFQGSCWFMKRSFWDSTIGPMDDVNYGPFAQEAQEIGNKAWLSGGAVMVNKKTWYAHWHRTGGYGFTNDEQIKFKEDVKKGRQFSIDFWTKNKWPKQKRTYQWLLNHFDGKDK